MQYVIYSVTSLGFIPQSFDAIVTAIEMSIVQAHQNLKSGSIFINTGAFIHDEIFKFHHCTSGFGLYISYTNTENFMTFL